MDSSQPAGLKRRNHSVCRSEVDEAPPLPIFLQQGSAFPQIPQLAGTSPIDKYARILFPLTFALFNLAYWYIYLVKDTMEGARYVSATVLHKFTKILNSRAIMKLKIKDKKKNIYFLKRRGHSQPEVIDLLELKSYLMGIWLCIGLTFFSILLIFSDLSYQ